MTSLCAATLRASCRRNVLTNCSRLTISSSKWISTTASPSAAAAAAPTTTITDTKINQLVDDISALSLLQAADLITALKSRLNIQEIAMPTAAAAAPAAVEDAEEDAAKVAPKEKTIFDVRLESFDAGSKAKIIREVKALNSSLTLIEAKRWVDSVPKVLKENVPKDEAEELKKKLEALGAIIVVE